MIVRICRSFREGCLAAGVTPRADLDAEIDRRAMGELVHRHQCGTMGEEEFHQAVSALVGHRATPEELRRIHDAWILGEYGGVAQLIDRIHAAGAETACLSNTNHAHWEFMHGMPAFDAIRHRHASHLLGHCKPDAAIFKAFLDRTGFAPQSIIYFDDLIENVMAAAGVGWRAELIDPTQDTAPQIERALERHGVLRS
ncbi:MAG: HAD-IA family hydrolase [Phycisphaeraceae bacterium]|nr:HAD-IA family hydrolase [Phycisphaeraceae bacterium]